MKYYKANITLYMKARSEQEFRDEVQYMFNAYYYDYKTLENSNIAHLPYATDYTVEKIHKKEFENPRLGVIKKKVQKDGIYDEMCRVLTEYESDDDLSATDCIEMLYEMLVKIQNNWETIITADEE